MTYSLKRKLTPAVIKMDIALLFPIKFNNILVTVSELNCVHGMCVVLLLLQLLCENEQG